MSVVNSQTDEVVASELGARICQARLERNWTQSEIANQAGVGLRTVQRLETGHVGTQLTSFLRVLRVLGLLERLDMLLPPPVRSPVDELKMQSKQRKRASKQSRVSAQAKLDLADSNQTSENKPKWTWGE